MGDGLNPTQAAEALARAASLERTHVHHTKPQADAVSLAPNASMQQRWLSCLFRPFLPMWRVPYVRIHSNAGGGATEVQEPLLDSSDPQLPAIVHRMTAVGSSAISISLALELVPPSLLASAPYGPLLAMHAGLIYHPSSARPDGATAHVYLSTAKASALDEHTDAGDVLVVQLLGRKLWSYRARGEVQPRHQLMEPGATLLLPAHTLHSARATEDALSAHLTLELFDRGGSGAERETAPRQAIPAASDCPAPAPAAKAAHTRQPGPSARDDSGSTAGAKEDVPGNDGHCGIDRVPYESMSVGRFQREYLGVKPVIVSIDPTSVLNEADDAWSAETLSALLGHVHAQVGTSASIARSRLGRGDQTMDLSAYLNLSADVSATASDEPPYVFDKNSSGDGSSALWERLDRERPNTSSDRQFAPFSPWLSPEDAKVFLVGAPGSAAKRHAGNWVAGLN